MSVRADKRARLSVKSRGFNGVPSLADAAPAYDLPFRGPAAPLRRTGGIVFPYTPVISLAQQVEYSSYEVVHTNYQQNSYSKTRNPQIQVTGTFVSQTPDEALYTIGVMHFLRVITKMNWGRADPDAGTPPPVLEFSAYGDYNFRRVPVVVGSFNFIYEDSTDYIEVVPANADGAVQIPTIITIAIDLLPQYSPGKQNQFDLRQFANGDGYRAGFI